MFGNGEYLIGPPDANRTFKLKSAYIGVPSSEAHDLFWDLEVLFGIAKESPADSQEAADALYTANAIINAIHPGRREYFFIN